MNSVADVPPIRQPLFFIPKRTLWVETILMQWLQQMFLAL